MFSWWTTYYKTVKQITSRVSKLPIWSLQLRHNERDGASSRQHIDCLFSRLFMRASKKTSKLRVNGFCEGNPLVTGGFPSQRQVTRKMFPFDDVIMNSKKRQQQKRKKWTTTKGQQKSFRWQFLGAQIISAGVRACRFLFIPNVCNNVHET